MFALRGTMIRFFSDKDNVFTLFDLLAIGLTIAATSAGFDAVTQSLFRR